MSDADNILTVSVNELLPNSTPACPFCKRSDNLSALHRGRTLHWVRCRWCEAEGPVSTTAEEALRRWGGFA